MVNQILRNIADFLELNTGTFLKDGVYSNVQLLPYRQESYPAAWIDGAREAKPLLQDKFTNYGYLRQTGPYSISESDNLTGGDVTEVADIPVKLVIHYREEQGGDTSREVAEGFWQFMGKYEYISPAGDLINDVKVQPSTISTIRDEVFREETTAESKMNSYTRIVSIDFDLLITFTDSKCLQSDVCWGDLGTISQVTNLPLSVFDFGRTGICKQTVTYAEAVAIKTAGTITNCLYYLSDLAIYLWGLSSNEFGLTGWMVTGSEVYGVEFDFDSNEIYRRWDRYGNEYKATPLFISLFGNSVAAFPWADSAYQEININNSFFTHSGFSGLALALKVADLSNFNISAYTGNVQQVQITGQSTVTLTGTGNALVGRIHNSSAFSANGSLSGFLVENSGLLTTGGAVLSQISVQNGSELTISEGGTHSNLYLDKIATIEKNGSGNLTNFVVINSFISIENDASGNYSDWNIIDSSIQLNENSGDINGLSISQGELVVDANTKDINNLKIEYRTVVVGNESGQTVWPAKPYIGKFTSNVIAQRTISGGSINLGVSPLNCNYCGIVEITANGTATGVQMSNIFPEWGILRIQPAAGVTITLSPTAVASATAGAMVMDKASATLVGHASGKVDYTEFEHRDGILFEIRTKNYL